MNFTSIIDVVRNIENKKISITELGIDRSLGRFNLDPNQIKWIPINFKIPKNTLKGEYIAKISLNGEPFDTYEYITFGVE